MSLSSPSADEIKACRASLGLSQVRLAEVLGVSRRTVEEWEAGRNDPPPYLRLALEKLEEARPDR